MPRITRKQQKIFAENATNNGVFGSLQGNDPTTSSDPDAIQGRTAYSNGWNDATYSAELLPPLEEFQALQYLFSRQIAYTMQEGVPEWDASTTYYKGALVKAIQSDGSFILYASLIDSNTGNSVTDTTKWVITNTSTNFHQGIPNWRADVIYSEGDWVKSQSGGKWCIFESKQNNNLNNAVSDTDYWYQKPFAKDTPLLSFMWSDHKLNDISWLRADSFSWQSGNLYAAVYNHLEDDVSGISPSTETIGNYTVTYYLASDGHKIVMADMEETISNIYTMVGASWYFVLDTTNKRFKLPRTKFGFTGLRDGAGNYVSPGLPIPAVTSNATTTERVKTDQEDQTHWVATGAQTATITIVPDNIYGKSTTVQPPATQMYLYFYVGEYDQTAIEQTAGVTTEVLDEKADIDADNLSDDGKILISGLGMPSDTYEELTLGASGTDYEAPANGYFQLDKEAGVTGNYYLSAFLRRNDETSLGCAYWFDRPSASTERASFLIPIRKGQKLRVSYTITGTLNRFSFIYAEGSESEA